MNCAVLHSGYEVDLNEEGWEVHLLRAVYGETCVPYLGRMLAWRQALQEQGGEGKLDEATLFATLMQGAKEIGFHELGWLARNHHWNAERLQRLFEAFDGFVEAIMLEDGALQ